MSSPRSDHPRVAVVGMGCWYPGANNLQQLWENILARRQQFRRTPDCRLPLSDYHDPDPQTPDTTYGTRMAVIDGFEFDWAERRIPKSVVESADLAQWLALEVATQAIEDAGYARNRIPSDRTGVVLGNTLTGEFSRSTNMRMRWPYVRRALIASAQAKSLPQPTIDALVETMEAYYKSVFYPITEDTLAGNLSNTIAGRICNFFNLHGGGYTVDGACSSSLIAIATAANGLVNSDLDLAIAGGVDISLDTFELIGFAKTGALTATDMTVYDRSASGFIPGEGSGFVVLKRLEDARANGDYVYAVLNGWGISSDGKGGITAPSNRGQALALGRAYERAGYSPRSLDFIEGHGTGTTVGDRVELEGVALAMEADGEEAPPRSCGMTSFKSIVGHTKAAAGVGAFIKSVIAVNRRILPPTAGCKTPNPVFETSARCLYPILQGEIRRPDDILRAGVSAMGFGGINCHVTLESGDAPAPRLEPSVSERSLLVSNQETEVFVLAAPSVESLIEQTRSLRTTAGGLSVAELVDLAAHLSRQIEAKQPLKAAVIATQPSELVQQLTQLEQMLYDRPPAPGEVAVSPQQEIWVSNAATKNRVGFLFPGQGSQRLNMARVLVERYEWARELVEQAQQWLSELGFPDVRELIYVPRDRAHDEAQVKEWFNALAQTEIAQPAICLASLLWLSYLERLGIQPVAVGGHSLGELSAFHAAGAFDAKSLLTLAALRGQAMSVTGQGHQTGAMASLACAQATAEQLLQQVQGYIVLANLNSPQQMVLSGEQASIEQVVHLAEQQGIQARRLPVSNGFHSQLVASAAEQIKQQAVIPETLQQPKVALFSSTDGQQTQAGLQLREHFANQVLSQVNFISLVKSLEQQCDLLVEVGPGRVLSGLVSQINGASGVQCFAVESKAGQDRDLNVVLANLFVRGCNLQWPEVYAGRLVRPFVPASERQFIVNPIERPFEVSPEYNVPAPGLFAPPTQQPAQPVEQPFTGQAQVPVPPQPLIGSPSPRPPQPMLSAHNVSPNPLSNNPSDQVSWEDLGRYISQRGNFLAALIRADLQSAPYVPAQSQPQAQPNGYGVANGQAQAYAPGVPNGHLQASHYGVPNGYAQPNGYGVANGHAQAYAPGTPNGHTQANGHALAQGVATPTQAETLENASDRAPTGQANVEAFLVDFIVQKTGFPTESITSEIRLLDDLNLDSIKAGELIATATQEFGVAGKVDPASMANATLTEIAEAIQAVMPSHGQQVLTATTTAQAAAQPQATPKQDVETFLVNFISKQTGFPTESITSEIRLLDDLNLDSIKAGELIAATTQEFGVAGKVDPASMANATIAEIVESIRGVMPESGTGNGQVAAPTNKTPSASEEQPKARVRDYIVRTVAEESTPVTFGQHAEENWTTANVALLCEQSDLALAETIGQELVSQGAKVQTLTFATAQAQNIAERAEFTHLIALLPAQPSGETDPETLLRQAIERQRSVATPPPAAQGDRAHTTVAYIQFGGGHFGAKPPLAAPEQCCALGYASSLHLERSDLKVRVLDFDPAIAPTQIAQRVRQELTSAHVFLAVGFDANLTRYIPLPEVQDPVEYEDRGITWTSEDVIVVTGGGKGITAECAFTLACETGARMALIGRSTLPERDQARGGGAEILRTLDRFSDAGLTCRYYSCDVADSEALQGAIAQIQQELGPVTGIVHGAALNRPRLVNQVSVEEALEEVKPKLQGLLNLCQIFATQPLKLFAGFSSVIGVTGMIRNSWYGFANETLDLILRRFHAQHPETAVVTFAYSVWDEVGMGARMGSVRSLDKMGIKAIPKAEGAARFLHLIKNKPADLRVVIAAPMQTAEAFESVGLDTWYPRRCTAPSDARFRFLEQVSLWEPGVEMVARAHLSLERDSYLVDHLYKGSYLFPTVFGLEAMAQTVAFVTGRQDLCEALRIEDIRLQRPIVVDPQSGLEIEIHAEVLEREFKGAPQKVSVGIKTQKTGFTVDHFAATFVLGGENQPAVETLDLPEQPLDLQPPEDLYNWLLFQGPRFQRIQQVYSLDAQKCVFQTQRILGEVSDAPGPSDRAEGPFLLGDPYYRDSLLQSGQLVIPQDTCLPVRIDAIEIYPDAEVGEQLCVAIAAPQGQEGKTFYNMVTAYRADGQVIEKLTGYWVQLLEHHSEYPTAEELAQPSDRDENYLRQQISQRAAAFGVTAPEIALAYIPNLQQQSRTQRREQERPLFERAIARVLPNLDSVDISWTDTGKPVVRSSTASDLEVSLSHDARLCLGAAGRGTQGCDIEPITRRTLADWHALLSDRRQPLLERLSELETADQAGTRIWSAVEAIRKATQAQDIALEIQQVSGDGVLFNSNTGLQVLTFPVQLTRSTQRMVALVVQADASTPAATTSPVAAVTH